MAPAPNLMTADQYFRTPETLRPSELAYGVLRVAEAPSPRHQSAVASLFLALDAHARAHAIGTVWIAPLDVVLDEGRALIVQPDLMVISRDQAWIVQDRIRGAPDLVVEVLSPNPRIGSIDERVGWFAEYGVRECWLVHQDRRDVTVLEFASGRIWKERVHAFRDPIHSVVLPGFSTSLANILAAYEAQ